MSSRWRSEEGWTLVTAIILMTVMLGVGLATATMVDTQAKQSAVTRERDTAFNFAESALNAQIYALSLRWPGYGYNAAAAYGNYACTSAGQEPTLGAMPANQQQLGAATPVCPSPATLGRLLNNVDAQGASWRTWVFDDPSPTASAADRGKSYSDALVAAGDSITTPSGTVATVGGAGYDSNKDGKLWVKAQATVRGHTRTLVSLVKVDTFQQDVINTALLAGSVEFSNKGNHSGFFIDQSTASAPNVMTVRCDPAADPGATCLGYPASDRDWSAEIGGAINPPNYSATPTAPNALDAPTLDELMGQALTDKTYYDNAGSPHTCAELNQPPAFTFHILYVKDCGLISWSSNAVLNSPEEPGIILLDNTRLRVTGNVTINGIVYARRPPAESPVVEIKGCSQIAGGLLVDDLGAVSIGSCSQADRPELLFVPTAFRAFKTYASAGIIQNTWRELMPR